MDATGPGLYNILYTNWNLINTVLATMFFVVMINFDLIYIEQTSLLTVCSPRPLTFQSIYKFGFISEYKF